MSRLPSVALAVIVILILSCAASDAAADSGTEGACAYATGDVFTLNGTSVSNYESSSVGQGCDPLLTAQYLSTTGATKVLAYAGWTDSDTLGNGLWHQQVVLTLPAQATGTYPLSSGASFTYTLDASVTCAASALSVTVTAYGDVGGLVTGTYSATLVDAQSTGRCPATLTGSFSVTRAQ